MGRHRNAEKTLQDQTNILPIGQLLIVFAGLAGSLLICFIDQNGLGVALPAISKDLHAQDTISWAATAPLIANTVCTVLYGRMSDIFGRKSVYLTVLALLCVADLLCGLAQDAPMLYIFRAIAGIATGGITNMTMIIVSDVVTLQERGKYQGILGSCVGLGNVIGPFLAAGFIQRATWRALFYLLCPLAAISCVITWFLLPSTMRPESTRSQLKKIDYWGILTSTIAIVFILIPVSGGGLYFSWDSPLVISMLVIGGCSLVAFLFVQWKVAALPMMPLSFFKNRVLAVLFLQSFFLGASYQSLLYYLPLYNQNARGWSPIESATVTLPMVLVQSIASICSGLYMSRRNRYLEVICTGFGLWLLGAGLTLTFDENTSKGAICGVLIVIGIGVGCTFQPTLVALQAHTTQAKRAVVISDRNFFRCGGGACGLAVSAAILQAVLKANLPANFQYLAHSTYAIPNRSTLSSSDWDIIVNAYFQASHAVFILQVPLVSICFLACVFIKDRGLVKPAEKDEQAHTIDSTTDTEVDIEGQDNDDRTFNPDKKSEDDQDMDAGHGAESVASSNAQLSEKV